MQTILKFDQANQEKKILEMLKRLRNHMFFIAFKTRVEN